MRTAVLCLIALVGCGRPAVKVAPPVAEQPVAATVEAHEARARRAEFNRAMLETARKSKQPPQRDLANGRFKQGDELAELTAAHPPKVLLEHGEYTTAVYGGDHYSVGISVVFVSARDGKLVCAFGGSCLWRVVFFDGLEDEQRQAWDDGFSAAYRAHLDQTSCVPDNAIPPPREVMKSAP